MLETSVVVDQWRKTTTHYDFPSPHCLLTVTVSHNSNYGPILHRF